MAPTLETIPPEIKHNIFSNLTRIADLKSLVHASASYYRTYLSDNTREKVLTELTLSELEARDVNLFHPVPFLEICLRDRARLGPETESALVAVRAQRKTQIRARNEGVKVIPRIKLSVAECVALLNIQDILPWHLEHGMLLPYRGDEYVLRALDYGRHNYYAMTDSPKWNRQQDNFQDWIDEEFSRRVLMVLRRYCRDCMNRELMYMVCRMLGARNDHGLDYWVSGR